MPNVFAIHGVSVVYANGDAYLDGETGFENPSNVCDQGFIGKYEGGNKTFIPHQNLPTIQPEISELDVALKKKRGAPVRTGSLVLQHISKFCDYISTAGMSPEEIVQIKKNKLPAFVTGQFLQGSRIRKEDCQGNNDYIAFDFDDTEIPLKKLLSVFKSLEILHYTTISDDHTSSKRRYRMVAACSRSMNLDEHERIMTYYKDKFIKLEKNLCLKHGLDFSKLTPWSKFFMPHKESTRVHLKHKRKPLDVDHLLSTIPLNPIVVSPTADDLDYKESTVTNGTGAQVIAMNPLMDNCRRLINQMGNGNRSSLAVKVGGMAKHLSPAEQDEIFASMLSKGVDKSAMKSAKRYAGRA